MVMLLQEPRRDRSERRHKRPHSPGRRRGPEATNGAACGEAAAGRRTDDRFS